MQQLFAIHSLHRIELDLIHHSIIIYLQIYFLINLSYQNTCPGAISYPLEPRVRDITTIKHVYSDNTYNEMAPITKCL